MPSLLFCFPQSLTKLDPVHHEAPLSHRYFSLYSSFKSVLKQASPPASSFAIVNFVLKPIHVSSNFYLINCFILYKIFKILFALVYCTSLTPSPTKNHSSPIYCYLYISTHSSSLFHLLATLGFTSAYNILLSSPWPNIYSSLSNYSIIFLEHITYLSFFYSHLN